MPRFEWCGHKGPLSVRGRCARCRQRGLSEGGKKGGNAWGAVKSASGRAGGKTGGKAWGPVKAASGRAGGETGGKAWGPAKAVSGQKGGNKSGPVKATSGQMAGNRSGLRRSTKTALVVKKQWLKKILAREKDWEIRGCRTTRRGWIHLAESGAGGKLVGRAKVVGCRFIPRSDFLGYVQRHHVTKLSAVPYKTICAWELSCVQKYKKPFDYQHPMGAVTWVGV